MRFCKIERRRFSFMYGMKFIVFIIVFLMDLGFFFNYSIIYVNFKDVN